ncbi:hypothetical protein [Acinetobacter phage vB_AbaP_HB01]|nr:hypothetical protein [Acinetobacter phage vB_AbaP_HB01]
MGNFSQFTRLFHEPPSRCWNRIALSLPIFHRVTPIYNYSSHTLYSYSVGSAKPVNL